MESTARKIERYNDFEYYNETQNYEYLTELINGEIVAMASPNVRHQEIALGLFVWNFANLSKVTTEM